MLRRLSTRSTKLDSRGILLACLLSFTNQGKETISLPEFLESVLHLQRALPLGYECSKDFLYSSKLFADIAEIQDSGYIRRYEYTHDGLLPKSYATLTLLGRGRAQKVTQKLDEEIAVLPLFSR